LTETAALVSFAALTRLSTLFVLAALTLAAALFAALRTVAFALALELSRLTVAVTLIRLILLAPLKSPAAGRLPGCLSLVVCHLCSPVLPGVVVASTFGAIRIPRALSSCVQWRTSPGADFGYRGAAACEKEDSGL
jgi:hypothetical protein